MMTLNNINWQLTTPVHHGQYAQREIVQHKRHARKRIVLLPAALLAFSLAMPVAASTFFLHGTTCQPVTASRNYVYHDQYGVSNLSNTAVATVECALPVACGAGCSLRDAQVYVYDRSTTANVSCTLRQTDARGVISVATDGIFHGRRPR